jgi:hypothetical protein
MAEMNKPLLQDVLPELSEELVIGLIAVGRRELAEQVPELRVWSRCRCNESYCTSFYVGPTPDGSWGDEGEHENEMPDVERGMVVLDVVSGVIRYVEMLDRPEIRDALANATQGESP